MAQFKSYLFKIPNYMGLLTGNLNFIFHEETNTVKTVPFASLWFLLINIITFTVIPYGGLPVLEVYTQGSLYARLIALIRNAFMCTFTFCYMLEALLQYSIMKGSHKIIVRFLDLQRMYFDKLIPIQMIDRQTWTMLRIGAAIIAMKVVNVLIYCTHPNNYKSLWYFSYYILMTITSIKFELVSNTFFAFMCLLVHHLNYLNTDLKAVLENTEHTQTDQATFLLFGVFHELTKLRKQINAVFRTHLFIYRVDYMAHTVYYFYVLLIYNFDDTWYFLSFALSMLKYPVKTYVLNLICNMVEDCEKETIHIIKSTLSCDKKQTTFTKLVNGI